MTIKSDDKKVTIKTERQKNSIIEYLTDHENRTVTDFTEVLGVSQTRVNYKISVTEYPFTGDNDWIVPGRIIASDYGKASGIKDILLNKLCSQIIHSFVWSVAGTSGKNGFTGFLVASDFEKDKLVYFVTLDDWITAMKFCISKASV